MKKLFEKNEITFAVVLIVIYVVGASLAQSVSEIIGIEYLAEMIFNTALGTVILVFILKNGLTKHVGLCHSEVSAAKMWFYIPIVVIAALPIFFGAALQLPVPNIIFRTVCMLFVGFIEEVIFRGFLFKGICKSSVTRAIVISAVTFGIGHIVNLFNGYDIFSNIMQIIFAVGVGFMLVYIFHKTGSLIACIGFHSLNNMLTGFTSSEYLINAVGSEETAYIILCAVRLLMMAVYTVYIIKALPDRKQEESGAAA